MLKQDFRFARYSLCTLFFVKMQETIATQLISFRNAALFAVFDCSLYPQAAQALAVRSGETRVMAKL